MEEHGTNSAEEEHASFNPEKMGLVNLDYNKL